MDRSTWKKSERRAAKLFGAERAALSGSNGKLTASDSTHDRIFLESKHSKQAGTAVWNLFTDTKDKAKLENKTPVLALFRKHSPGFLLVIHSDDILRVLAELSQAQRKKLKAAIDSESNSD